MKSYKLILLIVLIPKVIFYSSVGLSQENQFFDKKAAERLIYRVDFPDKVDSLKTIILEEFGDYSFTRLLLDAAKICSDSSLCSAIIEQIIFQDYYLEHCEEIVQVFNHIAAKANNDISRQIAHDWENDSEIVCQKIVPDSNSLAERLSSIRQLKNKAILCWASRTYTFYPIDIEFAIIDELENPKYLYDIGLTIWVNDSVRSYASKKYFKRYTDQEIEKKATDTTSEDGIRRLAISIIEDQKILSQIAQHDKNKELRLTAIYHMKDQDVLTLLATQDEDNAIRTAATEKVTDPLLLKNIFLSSSGDIQELAFEKINKTDSLKNIFAEQEILTIVLNSELDLKIRKTMLNGIDDQKLLIQVIQNEKNKELCIDAISHIHDQNVLTSVATTAKEHDLRSAAAEKVIDPNLLRKIILSNYSDIQKLAIQKIEDLSVLRDLVLFCKDAEYHEMKAIALSKIDNKEMIDSLVSFPLYQTYRGLKGERTIFLLLLKAGLIDFFYARDIRNIEIDFDYSTFPDIIFLNDNDYNRLTPWPWPPGLLSEDILINRYGHTQDRIYRCPLIIKRASLKFDIKTDTQGTIFQKNLSNNDRTGSTLLYYDPFELSDFEYNIKRFIHR